MYCDAPTVAYRKPGIDRLTGKHYAPFEFRPFRSDDDLRSAYNNPPKDSESLLLPCGKCMLCTRAYRRMWVYRCMHEAHDYSQMSYITLTVSDDYIDEIFPRLQGSCFHSLCHKPFQDFMKRLRRQLSYGYHYDVIEHGKPVHNVYRGESPIRFFMCGEYGDQFHRPHFHVIVYGFWPPDAVLVNMKRRIYRSDLVRKLWKFGIVTVQPVEEGSISYVAGYVDKKLDNARMEWAYNVVNPEYVCMSRGCSKFGTGGIGRSFFDKFYNELYPIGSDGKLIRNYGLLGKIKVKMPRYYDDLLDLRDKRLYDILCGVRSDVGDRCKRDFSLDEWINESHRRHAVAIERRLQRDPGSIVKIV